MSKERDIKKWSRALDEAVEHLRALGVEPNIAPPLWMQEMEAYRAIKRASYDRLLAGGASGDPPEEQKERHRLFSALIELMGVHKAMDAMSKIDEAEIERYLEAKRAKANGA